jgi:hypothetical protein
VRTLDGDPTGLGLNATCFASVADQQSRHLCDVTLFGPPRAPGGAYATCHRASHLAVHR